MAVEVLKLLARMLSYFEHISATERVHSLAQKRMQEVLPNQSVFGVDNSCCVAGSSKVRLLFRVNFVWSNYVAVSVGQIRFHRRFFVAWSPMRR